MFGIGLTELLIVCFIVLVIFGAGKLPSIMSGVGQGLMDFKKAISFDPDKIPKEDAHDLNDK